MSKPNPRQQPPPPQPQRPASAAAPTGPHRQQAGGQVPPGSATSPANARTSSGSSSSAECSGSSATHVPRPPGIRHSRGQEVQSKRTKTGQAGSNLQQAPEVPPITVPSSPSVRPTSSPSHYSGSRGTTGPQPQAPLRSQSQSKTGRDGSPSRQVVTGPNRQQAADITGSSVPSARPTSSSHSDSGQAKKKNIPVPTGTTPQRPGDSSPSLASGQISPSPSILAPSPQSATSSGISGSVSRSTSATADFGLTIGTMKVLISPSQSTSATGSGLMASPSQSTSATGSGLMGGCSKRSRSNSPVDAGPAESPHQEEDSSASKKKKKKKNKRPLQDPLPLPPPPPPHGIHLPQPTLLDKTVETLKAEVVGFLKRFQDPGTGSQLYKTRVQAEQVLVIDFNHVLSESKDLACTICNAEEIWISTWLNSAVQDFVKDNCSISDHIQVKAQFINKPDRIYRAKDLLGSSEFKLVRTVALFRGKHMVEAVVATFRGRTLFRLILWAVLERIANGESWLGQLTLDDFVFVEELGELRALIVKEPVKGSTPDDGALDLKGVWEDLEPFYVIDGVFPIYFEQLKIDLTTATGADMRDKKFLEYLKFAAGLASSMARRALVSGLFLVLCNAKLKPKLKELFNVEPLNGADWRDEAKRSKILLRTYMFRQLQRAGIVVFDNPVEVALKQYQKTEDNRQEKRQDGEIEGRADKECVLGEKGIEKEEGKKKAENEEKKQPGDGTPRDEHGGMIEEIVFQNPQKVTVAVKKQRGEEGKSDQPEKLGEEVDQHELGEEADQPENELVVEDNFQNTIGGLLTFSRHSQQHPPDFINVRDINDPEIYGAMIFWYFLPLLIKELLRICNMEKMFDGTWSLYKASFGDKKD